MGAILLKNVAFWDSYYILMFGKKILFPLFAKNAALVKKKINANILKFMLVLQILVKM